MNSLRSRGQALIETAIMIPVLFLAMGGIFWAGQTTIVYERMQNSLRYANSVEFPALVALSQSVDVLYEGAQGINPPTPCAQPVTSFYDSSQVSAPKLPPVHRAGLFVADNVPTTPCSSQFYALTGHGLSRDLLVYGNYAQVKAVPRSFLNGLTNFLPSGLNEMTLHAETTTFQAIPLASILTAYPQLAKAATDTLVNGSSAAGQDPTSPVTVWDSSNWNVNADTAPLPVDGSIPALPGSGGFNVQPFPGAPAPPSAPLGNGIEGSGAAGGGGGGSAAPQQQTQLQG